MIRLENYIRYIPAIAFAVAVVLRSKDISNDLKKTKKSVFWGKRLADLKSGDYFHMKDNDSLFQKVGVNPMLETVFNPFLTHLTPVMSVNSGVIYFESGDLRVRKVR